MKNKIGPCKDCNEVKKYHHGRQCHDCYKKYQRDLYASKPDEYNARSATYYIMNRESILKKAALYYQEHKEERLAYSAWWSKTFPDKKAVSDKRWKENNVEKDKMIKIKHKNTPLGRSTASYHNARRRGIYWNLPPEIYIHYEGAWCYYCEWIMKRLRRNIKKVYNPVTGMDRWNNVDYLMGYRFGNVVPCCEEHNRLKSYRNGGTFLKLIDPFTRQNNCPVWTGKKYVSGPQLELTYKEREQALLWIADHAKVDKRRKSIDPLAGLYLT